MEVHEQRAERRQVWKVHASYPIFALLLGWMAYDPRGVIAALSGFTSWFHAEFDWLVIGLSTFFLIFSFVIAFSPYGKVRLGKAGEMPSYSTLSWLAMLFSAGMGTGLVFWGVAEPLTHFGTAPPLTPAGADEHTRILQAMMVTHLHWGLHPWAIYAVSALSIAYFAFRHDLPLLPSSAVLTLVPTPVAGFVRQLVDVIAIAAVVFGMVATIGMGSIQLKAGLDQFFDFSFDAATVQIGLIAILAVCYIISASTPLSAGIKTLSDMNMVLCFLLMGFVFIVGPTREMIALLFDGTGAYLSQFLQYPFEVLSAPGAQKWQSDWTISYYLWWIAWGPFVGVFIARISRGRRLRDFVLGVVAVPTLFSLVWFSILGGGAFAAELRGGVPILATIREDYAMATYELMAAYPFADAMRWLIIGLSFIFVVSGADSGAYVLALFSEPGKMKPSQRSRLFWGVAMGLLSAGAIYAKNGIEVVRIVSSVGAIPFLLILVLQLVALCRQLYRDFHRDRPRASHGILTPAGVPQSSVTAEGE